MKTFLAFLLAALFSIAAFGQQDESAASTFRNRLQAKGLSFGLSYTSEVFATAQGGQYLGSVSGSVELDLRLLRAGRGRVFIGGQQLHGQGINDRLAGAIQAPSNLEGERFRKFTEVWYADSWLNGKLRSKAGRHYADSEFGVTESAANFLNAGYGVIPTAPMPTYPDPELGVSVWASPSRRISVGAGIYRGGSLTGGGPFAVLESRIEAARQTSVRVGCWRQGPNHGLYAVTEHRLGEGDRAASVFARWGWAPEGGNDIAAHAGSGITYRGIGVGATSVRPTALRTEIVCEAFYRRQLTQRVVLQPDLQWVSHAGGSSARRLVAGVRLRFEL